ncbi:hypothetical protein TNCV_4732961 [Trichonephila clavipes]|nr:hypothetical protein TNCV_4732961 [Trichonephila clavipes]
MGRYWRDLLLSRRFQWLPNSPTWSPKTPSWSSKMMLTSLYRQDFAKFSLNRHYNTDNGAGAAMLTVLLYPNDYEGRRVLRCIQVWLTTPHSAQDTSVVFKPWESSNDSQIRYHGFGYSLHCITESSVFKGVVNDEPGRTNGETFQQDNAQVHVAGIVRTLLDAENVRRFP